MTDGTDYRQLRGFIDALRRNHPEIVAMIEAEAVAVERAFYSRLVAESFDNGAAAERKRIKTEVEVATASHHPFALDDEEGWLIGRAAILAIIDGWMLMRTQGSAAACDIVPGSLSVSGSIPWCRAHNRYASTCEAVASAALPPCGHEAEIERQRAALDEISTTSYEPHIVAMADSALGLTSGA